MLIDKEKFCYTLYQEPARQRLSCLVSPRCSDTGLTRSATEAANDDGQRYMPEMVMAVR